MSTAQTEPAGSEYRRRDLSRGAGGHPHLPRVRVVRHDPGGRGPADQVGKDGPPSGPHAAGPGLGGSGRRPGHRGSVRRRPGRRPGLAAPAAAPAPLLGRGAHLAARTAAAPPAATASVVDTTGCVAVRSPAVGAFWVAPGPGQPPFVEVGQTVAQDEQLAIVEVMKLMNPVVATARGRSSGLRRQRGDGRVRAGAVLDPAHRWVAR